MSNLTATVEVLTAEVRTLMVGNRQVTQSVYKQLDWIEPEHVEPFGRVHESVSNGYSTRQVNVVGRHVETRALIRSGLDRPMNLSAEANPPDDLPQFVFRLNEETRASYYSSTPELEWPKDGASVCVGKRGQLSVI